MSIVYSIPKHSRFLQKSVTFEANFNTPTLGKYDFAGQEIDIMETIPNSIYFLDRINVGGTISENDYLYSIETLPEMSLRYLIDNVTVFPHPLPIVNYIDNQEANAFLWSDKSNDRLKAKFSGILSQTPILVGVAKIKINVQFNFYEITDNNFISDFKNVNSNNIGQSSARSFPDNKFYVRQ